MHIHFEDVTVRRGERAIIDTVSLTLKEHRIGLVGSNGSGKSTFLRLLNALVTADTGRISVNDMDPTRDTVKVRREIGFVFQDPEAQIVMPTVAEEIAFGLKSFKLEAADRDNRIATELDRFGLAGRGHDSAHLLSGGEKQRLALASILAMKPGILVMDEPTAMLDLAGRRDLQRHINTLPQPIILATHDLALLEGFERVLVLHDGKIAADDTPANAIAAYETLIIGESDAPSVEERTGT